MKKQSSYDEFYSNGFIELGRIGNLVSMKNNFTESDIEKRDKIMAQQFEEKKLEIDNLIDEIVDMISQCNPLNLLLEAISLAMANMINIVSEIQLDSKQNFELRSVEYIQSILVSKEPSSFGSDKQDEMISVVLEKINELYGLITVFYLYWASKMRVENDEFDDEELIYIVESQFMGNVRGKRYQFQQLNIIEKLLFPHSDKLQEIYSVSAEEVLCGLKKLEQSLSTGKLDSMKELYEEFIEFQENAKGKTIEEIDMLFEKIGNSKKNLETCAKCFGTDLYNVKKVTGWSDRLIDSLSWELGECGEFLSEGEFAGWPVIDLPVQKRPFIKINNISYCFDYYNLFDNIYRIIQKDLKRHDDKYTTKWADIQQQASELLVEGQLKKLLPGCKSYVGNYYPDKKSKKQRNENDILILYDNTIIIVEVKAGSFTYTPAITDYVAHKKSFETLVGKADYQCERTLEYVNNNREVIFYEDSKSDKKKVVIDREKYDNIYTLCVTVDNFNVFEAKIEKTHFFDVSNGIIAVSVDDLEVYTEYFDSPLYFLHYLQHRKAATSVKSLLLNDELDHLGMYIVHNAYEVFVDEFGECDAFVANGYREDLDAYFAGLYNSELQCEKPVQNIPAVIIDIISYVEDKKMEDRVSFSSFLLDLHPDTREEVAESIVKLFKRQAESGKMFPFILNGDFMLGCFIEQDGILMLDEEIRLKYMYANMLKINREQGWYMVLTYEKGQKLQKLRFRSLSLNEIDGLYDKKELMQIAENIFQKRVKEILKRNHKKKIYRNDPCPCGSGKKYKMCCGRYKR